MPKRRGQDPTADTADKALQRLATKGVVRLFNAIAKAQKQLREAEEETGSRAKAVKLGKASFLAQLKSSSGAAAGSEALVPAAPVRAGTAAAPAPAGSKQQQQRGKRAAAAAESSDEEDAGGWDVLKAGFTGMQGVWALNTAGWVGGSVAGEGAAGTRQAAAGRQRLQRRSSGAAPTAPTLRSHPA